MTVSLRKRRPLQVWCHLGIWRFTCSAGRWPHSGTGFPTVGTAGDMARLHLRKERGVQRPTVASGSG